MDSRLQLDFDVQVEVQAQLESIVPAATTLFALLSLLRLLLLQLLLLLLLEVLLTPGKLVFGCGRLVFF